MLAKFFTDCFVGLLTIAIGSLARAAPTYTVRDLGVLWAHGPPGAAMAINDSGEVVGLRSNVPFLYSNGVMISLDTSGSANDINNNHQVVGVSSSNGGFLYTGGTRVELGDLGYGGDVVALGTNDVGQIVGYAFNGQQTTAFLYANGALQDLGTLGSSPSAAYDINDSGQAVGVANNIAVMFTGTEVHPLGTLGGTASIARRINDFGYAIGDSYLPDNSARHATMFFDGAVHDLAPSFRGSTFAYDINNAGKVVGTALPATDDQFAFFYEHGNLTDLNRLIDPILGWSLTNGVGINDRGQITGMGYLHGEYRAYLLTPVEIAEPQSIGLVALGLLVTFGAWSRPRPAPSSSIGGGCA